LYGAVIDRACRSYTGKERRNEEKNRTKPKNRLLVKMNDSEAGKVA
jgi:hypothetical protein